MKKLLIGNILTLMVALLFATWIFGSIKDSIDMIFVVLLMPIFGAVFANTVLLGFILSIESKKAKVLVLLSIFLLLLIYLILSKSLLITLFGIWIGLAFLIDIWTVLQTPKEEQ